MLPKGSNTHVVVSAVRKRCNTINGRRVLSFRPRKPVIPVGQQKDKKSSNNKKASE